MLKYFLCSIFLVVVFHVYTTTQSPVIERIVNGTNTIISDYPFMVSLKGPTKYHICGGSIVSSDWILTAAHCIAYGISPDNYSVQYAVTNITKDGDTIANISLILVHPNFNNLTLTNDIALLKLESPLRLSKYARAVELPILNQYTPSGTNAVVIGWGMNASDGSYQQNLQKVQLITLTYAVCNQIHYNDILSTQICAGIPEGGKGQCEGDSGGPLIYNNKIIGIVSWSIKPCAKKYPGVYTQVASFRTWIKEIVGF